MTLTSGDLPPPTGATGGRRRSRRPLRVAAAIVVLGGMLVLRLVRTDDNQPSLSFDTWPPVPRAPGSRRTS